MQLIQFFCGSVKATSLRAAMRCRTGGYAQNISEPWWSWWWKYGYGSIPINTIFRGMNIHLPAILMFTRGTRFWHTAIWINHLILLDVPSKHAAWVAHDLKSTQLQGAGGSKPYQIQTWIPINHHKSKRFGRNHGIFFFRNFAEAPDVVAGRLHLHKLVHNDARAQVHDEPIGSSGSGDLHQFCGWT